MKDRRMGLERRLREDGPPEGLAERRKCAERRLPVAEVTELSVEDFVQMFGSAARDNNVDYQSDVPGRVLDRVNGR